MSQFKDVNVVYMYVKDWERAKKFYDDILGWKVMYNDDNIGWREYGMDDNTNRFATHVAIQRSSPEDQGQQGVGATITFSVESVDKTQAWLKSIKVKVDDVLVIPGIIKIGTFYDPEGNRLQFAESQQPPA